jgi:diguanylate cyclase (GGDEF)-like protein/PAS domain S-box-containing protein
MVAVCMAAHVVHPDGWFGEATYLLVTVGAAGAAWLGVLHHPRGQRTTWSWVAAGVTSAAVAEIIYSVLTHLRGVGPDASAADVFWLASYVGIGVGVLTLNRGRPPVDALLNVAAVGVVSLLVVWQVSVSQTLADTSVAPGLRAIWAVYPLLDAVLLALVFHITVSGRTRSTAGLLLAAGAVAWLFADLLYLTPLADSLYLALDAGWMAGAALLAASTWPHPDRRRAAQIVDTSDDNGRFAMRMAVVGLAPLIVPSLFELWGYTQGEDPNPIPLVLATVVLAGLAMVRLIRLIHADRGLRQQLRSSEHHYRALAANSSDAVVILDEHGAVQNDAPNLTRLFGDWAQTDADANPLEWVLPEDLEEVSASFERVLMSPGVAVTAEVRFARPDGAMVWLASRSVNLLHDPDVNGIVVSLHDITARKQLEEELSHQAFHDSLTGLANRALLRDRLDQVFKRAKRTGVGAAVIYLDLDSFKVANDTLGHEGGDEVLRTVARRLSGAVRAGDTVARLGGDEFAIVTQESPQAMEEATAIADRVLQALSVPVVVEGQPVRVSASVGLAATGQARSAAEVLRDADVAMYRAKARGKGQWVVHDPAMRLAAAERQRLEADLPLAAETGQLHLEYQPVVVLASEQLIGFEALVRWDHPELGLLQPDRFISIAEETGAILDIGRWVLQAACETAAGWRERYPAANLTMAVNVSGRQLADRRFVGEVTDALAASGLPPECLVLEMTETALIEDAEATAELLQELHDLGISLAIDDFGTGYSSLSYLRRFPVDILKIDRSFIDTITDTDRIPAIVRGLIDLGHTLGLEMVAEGIERRSQQEHLRQQSCALGQGFLFARPLTRDAAEQLVGDQAAD